MGVPMWEKTKLVLNRIYVCGSIFLARVQVLLGIVWTVALATDLSPFFSNPKVLSGYLLFNGVAAELTRRYKTRDTLET